MRVRDALCWGAGAYVPITMLLQYPPASGSRSENTAANVRVSGVVFQIPQLPSPSDLQNYRFGNTGLFIPAFPCG